ncbi:hypothetical protein C8R46DRAFT_1053072 [Mycena filopes]|nr:hypothetical protein C8R46DRAFT_1053072 [Mycena filopes]
MSTRLSLLLLAAAASLVSVTESTNVACGNHVSPDVLHATRAQYALDRRSDDLLPRAAAPSCTGNATATANFNVHWHVLYANATYEGGNITDDQIGTQMAFLNEEWGKFAPLSFTLDLRGFSSFPWDSKNDTVEDGIVIKWNSLPGGTLKSNGGSLVHEVGHWLGLFHTFQNGCFGAGDEVDDTPAEDPINANRGLQTCPVSFDSCPDLPGQDPVHNYMTYADDECRTEFTKGQVARLMEQSTTYRGLELKCPDVQATTSSNSTSASGSKSNPSGGSAPSSAASGTGGAATISRSWAAGSALVVCVAAAWALL